MQYALTGLDGRNNALSLSTHGEQSIPVWLQPLPPRLVQQVEGVAIYEGGVELHLDLERVRAAGDYRGTLVVTVSRL